VLNPPLYLAWLEKSLREDGRVNFIQASLDSVEDAFKRVDDSDKYQYCC
jgi:hypothetical protein